MRPRAALGALHEGPGVGVELGDNIEIHGPVTVARRPARRQDGIQRPWEPISINLGFGLPTEAKKPS